MQSYLGFKTPFSPKRNEGSFRERAASREEAKTQAEAPGDLERHAAPGGGEH